MADGRAAILTGAKAAHALHRDLGVRDQIERSGNSRIDVFEGRRVGTDAGDVHSALVGKGVAPDVGLVGVGREVQQLIDEVRRLSEPAQLLIAETLVAELQLQVGDDRDQVRVAGALAVAVDRALDLARADLDRRERVCDTTFEVVVAVNADADAVSERRQGGGRRRGNLRGQ